MRTSLSYKEEVMPKVEISASKGLVQSSGEGLHIIGGTLADSVGIHTYQELVSVTAAGMASAAAQGRGGGARSAPKQGPSGRAAPPSRARGAARPAPAALVFGAASSGIAAELLNVALS